MGETQVRKNSKDGCAEGGGGVRMTVGMGFLGVPEGHKVRESPLEMELSEKLGRGKGETGETRDKRNGQRGGSQRDQLTQPKTAPQQLNGNTQKKKQRRKQPVGHFFLLFVCSSCKGSLRASLGRY